MPFAAVATFLLTLCCSSWYVVVILGIEDGVDQKLDMMQGALDLLILRVIRTRALHGWAISKRIVEVSRDVLQVNQGSLYPALYRLERQGFVEAQWGVSDEGRRAKFYEITPLGRKQLAAVENDWRRFSIAVELVLTSA